MCVCVNVYRHIYAHVYVYIMCSFQTVKVRVDFLKNIYGISWKDQTAHRIGFQSCYGTTTRFYKRLTIFSDFP